LYFTFRLTPFSNSVEPQENPLDEHAYILPGQWDAGDRIFGTRSLTLAMP
jgi:uracil phosphoribosyltransferase